MENLIKAYNYLFYFFKRIFTHSDDTLYDYKSVFILSMLSSFLVVKFKNLFFNRNMPDSLVALRFEALILVGSIFTANLIYFIIKKSNQKYEPIFVGFNRKQKIIWNTGVIVFMVGWVWFTFLL